jgi:GntR family transcriptional regulator
MEKSLGTLYVQVAQTLRERILAGKYAQGEMIPTEPQLCEEFHVSRITVRQAVAILQNEGMVIREQGRGTTVRDWYRGSLGWNYGHVDDLLFLGQKTRLQIKIKKKIRAPEDVKKAMDLPEGADVFYFKGIRHIQDKHLAAYDAYVIEALGKDIQIRSLKSPVLFVEIERITGQRIYGARQQIYAMVADKRLALEMKVRPGSPLLVTKRLYLSSSGKPILLATTHFPGEAYQSFSTLKRE